jgi:riboflavin synthase alpha subunit
MFTGLIQEIGKIASLTRQGDITRLRLTAPKCAPELRLGDSLAVNGICLTVTGGTGSRVELEAAAETRRVTTLRRWRVGDRVHLETALHAGDPLGGHLVLGHVDGVGEVLRRESSGRSIFLTLELPAALTHYLLPKGSVAINGVSLTVADIHGRARFTVNVIPHTLASTCLGDLRRGDQVNLEMDVLVKAAQGVRRAPELSFGTNHAEEAARTQAAIGTELDRQGRSGTAKLTLERLLARGFRRRNRDGTGS